MPSQDQGLNFGWNIHAGAARHALCPVPSGDACKRTCGLPFVLLTLDLRKWIGLSYLSMVISTSISKVELKSSHFLWVPHVRLEKVERTSIFKHDYLHLHKQGGTKEFLLSRELSLSSLH
jgi:hypothetical protein